MQRATLLFVSAALLLSLCGGCNKFTRANYDTVYVGQPADDVQRTLGEPTVRFDNQWTYIHDGPFYKANIYYRDGKVQQKLWFDEKEMPRLPSSGELNGDGKKTTHESTEVVQ